MDKPSTGAGFFPSTLLTVSLGSSFPTGPRWAPVEAPRRDIQLALPPAVAVAVAGAHPAANVQEGNHRPSDSKGQSDEPFAVQDPQEPNINLINLLTRQRPPQLQEALLPPASMSITATQKKHV